MAQTPWAKVRYHVLVPRPKMISAPSRTMTPNQENVRFEAAKLRPKIINRNPNTKAMELRNFPVAAKILK